MRKPNFFIIGAPKCGTTWLYRYLKAHPAVFMPEAKEPHYFNFDSGFRRFKTLSDYEALFANVGAEKTAIGEASVWNLFSRVAVKNILEYSPEARFIVLIRNPIEMAQSLHRQMLFNNDEDQADFMASWRLQEARSRGDSIPSRCREPSILIYKNSCALGSQLQRLFALVPKDRVHIVLQEDIKSQPISVYGRVLDFLGLDQIIPEHFAVVHSARKRRNQKLKRVIDQLASFKKKLGLNVKFGILSSVSRFNIQAEKPSGLSADAFSEVAPGFAGEIRLIEEMTGRDLRHWMKH